MFRSIQFTGHLNTLSVKAIKGWEPQTRFLVLLGDLGCPTEKNFHCKLRYLSRKYEKVVLVPGIKELTCSTKSLAEMFALLHNTAEQNTRLEILHNRAIELDGVSVFGSVMWPPQLSIKERPYVMHHDEKLIKMTDSDLESLHRNSVSKYLAWKRWRPESLFACATYFPLSVKENNCFNSFDRI